MEDKVRETKYLRAIAKQILMVEHLPRRKRGSRYSGTKAPAYAKALAGRKAKVEIKVPAYAKALAGREAKDIRYNAIKPKLLMRIKS